MIGITFGAFDLCHTGHVLMFNECKQHCDLLYVGLQTDPTIERPLKNKPIQTLSERYIQLLGCKYIDVIIPYTYENEIENLIKISKANIRFVGSDYKNRDFTAKKYCVDNNISIFYNSREHGFSTTELRERIENFSNR